MKNGLNLCHDSWITSGSKPVSKEIWNQSKTYSKDELSQWFAVAEVQKSTLNFPQPPSAPCLSKQQDESSRGESGWHARPRWKEMFGASILLLGNSCCSVAGKLFGVVMWFRRWATASGVVCHQPSCGESERGLMATTLRGLEINQRRSAEEREGRGGGGDGR